jgi:uncharacterized Zn-binding protein involved in type VI secretion
MSEPTRVDFTRLRGCWRGKSFGFDIDGIVLAAGDLQSPNVRVICTVKRNPDSDADPGLAQLDTDDGDALVTSGTSLHLEFLPSQTDAWPSGAYPSQVYVWYDVQLGLGSDVKTIQRGIIAVHEPCTHTLTAGPPNFLEIFGDDLAVYLHAQDATVSSWADETGNLTISATGAEHPTLATGINGKPTVLFDGVANRMVGDMSAPLLSGTRPYILAVVSWVAVDGERVPLVLSGGDAGSPTYPVSNIGVTSIASIQTFYRLHSPAPGMNDGAPGPAADTLAHLWAIGWSATRAEKFALDGVSYTDQLAGTTPLTDAMPGNVGHVELGSYFGSVTPASTFVNIHVAEVIAIRRQPTSEELTAVYEYVNYHYAIALPGFP